MADSGVSHEMCARSECGARLRLVTSASDAYSGLRGVLRELRRVEVERELSQEALVDSVLALADELVAVDVTAFVRVEHPAARIVRAIGGIGGVVEGGRLIPDAGLEGALAGEGEGEARFCMFGRVRAVAAPVTVGGSVRGAIFFGRRSTRPFVDDERAALELLAGWLGGELSRREAIAAKAAAESALRTRSASLATISHELRTPMNGVVGMTEVLIAEAAHGPLRQRLETIRASGLALRELLDQMLDLARLEAADVTPVAAAFDPQAAVEAVVELMRPRAELRGLELWSRLTWPAELPVLGDGAKIRQVVANLVDNAIKFTAVGAVEVELEGWRVGGGAKLRIAVRDSGAGIPAEEQGRLFVPFERLSSGHKAPGTGLGLAICRALVERMGGEIHCESRLGEGTCFTVELPLELAAAPVAEAAPRSITAGAWRGRRVLVADDDELSRAVAAALLTHLGCEVEAVDDGDLAVERAVQGGYDAVFLDARMARMGGAEATAALRAHERAGARRLPVLAVTAAVMPEEREALRDAGVDGIVAKPLILAELDDALHRIWADAAPSAPRSA